MNTFTTRTAAVEFLVALGKPLANAKVAIDQGYNFDIDGDTSDLLRRMDPDLTSEKLNPNDNDFRYGSDDALAVIVDKTDLICMYDTFNDMLSVTDSGIEVDGEPMYDLAGNSLAK